MIILAFSNKTSKVLPRILCRKMKHVALIDATENQMTMYQFIRAGKIAKIQINMRDIKILGMHGWKFIYMRGNIPHDFNPHGAITCVQVAKHAIGMRRWNIQTPYALYKTLK